MAEQVSFDPSLISTPKPRKSRPVTPKVVEENFDNPTSFLDVKQATEVKKTGRVASDIKTIEAGLTQVFGMAGLGLSMWNTYDGLTVGMNAEILAKQWTKVAENNPTVKKWLLTMLKGGDLAAAIMATLGVGIAIASNHDIVDPKLADLTKPLGIKTPSREGMEFSFNGNGSTTSES